MPSVYFFYPETAYRRYGTFHSALPVPSLQHFCAAGQLTLGFSLEEMDSIFRRTHSIFGAVKAAQTEPYRYDKKGNLIIAHGNAMTGERHDAGDDDEKGANLVERSSS